MSKTGTIYFVPFFCAVFWGINNKINNVSKMEIVVVTGKTKTDELRITRAIGALGIAMTQPFSALTNETISAYIERADGNNTDILSNISLKAFMAGSVSEAPAIFQTAEGCSALAEICENGSIVLQETEAIRIKLDGLKSAVTYELHGIEYPQYSPETVKWSRKNLLMGETERKLNVANEELAVIENPDGISEVSVTYENGLTVKYTRKELDFISRDLDPVKIVDSDATTLKGRTQFDFPNMLNFPLVGVASVDFKKLSDQAVTIYLKNDSEKYS